jgi:hypothetical protein
LIIPGFILCQDAAWQEGDSFCKIKASLTGQVSAMTQHSSGPFGDELIKFFSIPINRMTNIQYHSSLIVCITMGSVENHNLITNYLSSSNLCLPKSNLLIQLFASDNERFSPLVCHWVKIDGVLHLVISKDNQIRYSYLEVDQIIDLDSKQIKVKTSAKKRKQDTRPDLIIIDIAYRGLIFMCNIKIKVLERPRMIF